MPPMTRHAPYPYARGPLSPAGRVPTVGPHDEEDLAAQLRAYLECRSHHVEPPASLVEAWDRFYDLYTPRIRGFLRRFGLPEADREDCLQDLWSKVLTRPSALPSDLRQARLSAWLMTVARNLAVDALRRRRRRCAEWGEDAFAVEAADPGPADACDRLAEQARLWNALAELAKQAPALSFRVFSLRAIDGLDTAEVADVLDLSPEQVRYRLHRMMRKLRGLFERSPDPDRPDGKAEPTRQGERTFSRHIDGPGAFQE